MAETNGTNDEKVKDAKRSRAMKKAWRARKAAAKKAKRGAAKKGLREQYHLDTKPRRAAKAARRAPRATASTQSELADAMGLAETLRGLLSPFSRQMQSAILKFIIERT